MYLHHQVGSLNTPTVIKILIKTIIKGIDTNGTNQRIRQAIPFINNSLREGKLPNIKPGIFLAKFKTMPSGSKII